ncbi:hypothetical protein CBR_g4180 [Chara braunii]|uniref:CSN8/PSMD8/EIF3K domain-containing protein n=1 Tax=Chara braunii TaxID=69332 RepID=A0A388KHI7_CHABU|nr:hypothetical protein CBR_g4180 [Chara braunii]|eukprot:GBG69486.1 hypothetical protein CBR_g4180 [Chara braunii]
MTPRSSERYILHISSVARRGPSAHYRGESTDAQAVQSVLPVAFSYFSRDGVRLGAGAGDRGPNSARFLWKRIPTNIKQSNQELAAVWAIVQKMWLRNRAQCHEAIRGFPWSPILQPVIAAVAEDYRESMYKLLCTAYSTISLADAAAFLGLPECDTVNLMVSRGCSIDPATKMLTVRARPTVTDQKTNMGHLQKLTEYVFHLEH